MNVLKKLFLRLLFIGLSTSAFSQTAQPGVITGEVQNDKKEALTGANVRLVDIADSSTSTATTTLKDGDFTLTNIRFGWYRLEITYIGYLSLRIDSIHFRDDRFAQSMLWKFAGKNHARHQREHERGIPVTVVRGVNSVFRG